MNVVPLLVAVAFVLQTPAPQTPAPPVDATGQAYFLFLEGHRLEGSGDVEGAIAAYRQAIQLLPKSADIHAELAGVYARKGDADPAVAEALEALKIDPNHPEGNRILGLVQSAMADGVTDTTRHANLVNEAIGHLEKALAGQPDLSAELQLATLYLEGTQYAKAIPVLRKFLDDRPDYPRAVLLLASAYRNAHQAADAIDLLETYLKNQPADLSARAQLAGLYESANKWKEAADQWADLASRNPRQTTYRIRYATALVNGGDLAAGRVALQQLTHDQPGDAGLWYLLSQVDRRAGDPDGAETAAKQITQIDPKDPRGPLAMADAQMARKDYAAAAATLGPFVATPRDEDIASGVFTHFATQLALAQQEGGDAAASLRTLEDAHKRVPDDVQVTLGLATAYEHDRKIDQAETLYRDLIAKDPENAEVLNNFGYMLADHGRRLDDAVGFIKRALALEDGNPSYLDSLGWAYFKQGKADQAREPLERAASAQPRNSVIQDHLGEMYFQLKRYKDAASAWSAALAGDKDGIDIAAVAKKRDKALGLVK